jgi:hypothetical protein
MAFPLFRFTLSNSIVGALQISEPIGWDEAMLKLERNEEYHSLVEFYEQPLGFYGQSSDGDGGFDYITEVQKSQGPDAQISITVDISEDYGDTYGNLFTGLLDITSIKVIDFYKLECGILRNDFWQKFINRKSTPVNLSGITDLDGNTRTVITPFTLSLPSQKIRQTFRTENYNLLDKGSYDVQYSLSATDPYAVIDLPKVIYSEVNEKFNYPTTAQSTIPLEFITTEFAGTYAFDINIYVATGPFIAGTSRTANLNILLSINGTSIDTLAITQQGTNGVDGRTLFSYAGTKNLNKGDNIFFYFQYTGGGGAPSYSILYNDAFSGGYLSSYFQILADTIYPDSTCSAFLLADAAESILSKTIGQNSVVTSNYISTSISPDGCGSHYALTKGLNVRGYSLTDKPFFLSFDDWWNGINPILCLGLGYSGSQIEISQRADFYNATPSINFDYVNKIEQSYNAKYIFKTVEMGYEKWSAESDSGIDDPQSKRKYVSRFKTVGEDTQVLSKFIAASLAIEQTRRNKAEIGKDWRLDNDTMIIALNDADTTRPELGATFSSITGLLNSDSRYNVRLSVARNFKRWLAFFNGCLKWYATNNKFKFASGEGNYDMTSTLASTYCEGDGTSVNEKGDIQGGFGTAFDFVPIVYDFEHPLTYEEYKIIRNNPKNAIGVSRTASGHVPCFIMNLEYQVTHSKGKFTVMLGQSTPL